MNKQDLLLLTTVNMAIKNPKIPIAQVVEKAKKLTDAIYNLTKIEPYQYDKEPLTKVIEYCAREGSNRYATRIENVFRANRLYTLEDLLEFGKRRLKDQQNLGAGSFSWIEHALYDLYGITF